MSGFTRHAWLRWVAPVAVAVVAVGAVSAFTKISAIAEPSLPPRSAASLLVDLQSADLTYGSGTVVQTANLGLPQLPSIGGAGSSDLTSLVSGNHTLRVWYGGPGKARVALMGTLGESDVVLNGRDLWTWSSTGNSATHRVLPAQAQAAARSLERPGDLVASGLTPEQVASRALAAIDPTTTVTTAGTAQVAGRSAYELVLAPKDGSSLIGQVRIAVDSQRHVPLRVQVLAKDATEPAAEVGFTQISFDRPSDAQFRFSPPPGAKVTQETADSAPAAGSPAAGSLAGAPMAGRSQPRFSGTGWTTVVQVQLPAAASAELTPGSAPGPGSAGPGELAGLLRALPRTSGAWGSGRVLRSSLFTVLLTDDGRLLAGAVSAGRLTQLAGQPLPAVAG